MDIVTNYRTQKRNKALKKIVVKAGIIVATYYFPVTAPIVIFTCSAYKMYLDYDRYII